MITLRSLGPQDADLCWAFYEEVYRAAFPKADQAENPTIWLPLLEGDIAGQPKLHLILACEDDVILGGVIFEWFHATHCWLATYIAVRPNDRRRGVATKLMTAMHQTIDADPFHLLFAETENPACMPIAEQHGARERLMTLAHLGLRRLPIAYVMPALGPDRMVVTDLLLLVHAEANVGATRVRAFLTEFYAALAQADSPWLHQMDRALAAQTVLRSEPLL